MVKRTQMEACNIMYNMYSNRELLKFSVFQNIIEVLCSRSTRYMRNFKEKLEEN